MSSILGVTTNIFEDMSDELLADLRNRGTHT